MGNLLLAAADATGEKEEGQERFGHKGNVVAAIQQVFCPSLKSHMTYRRVKITVVEWACTCVFMCIVHMCI